MTTTATEDVGGAAAGEGADQASRLNTRYGAPVKQKVARRRPFPIELYRSAVGKKYVMAITGHRAHGLRVRSTWSATSRCTWAPEDFNHYGEFLRELLVPFLPRTSPCGSCGSG